MISIIICHRSPKLLEQFKKNVAETIGTEFEFVIIDNALNQYNIFEAYNLGVKKSKGDVLCFAHEDILFHTQDWGTLLKTHLSLNKKVGLIGVVGGSALPACPAPWWNKHQLNQNFINIIQHWAPSDYKNRWNKNIALNTEGTIIHHTNNLEYAIQNKVAAVDGLFFAIPRTLFTQIKFDESNFSGFHGYDVDICLQVNNIGYDVIVVHDILIEHFSKGKANKEWSYESIVLARKWRKSLPIIINCKPELSQNEQNLYTIDLLLTFCYWSMQKLPDKTLKETIKEFLPKSKKILSKTHYFLWLWKSSNYTIARIVFKFTKHFINDL